MRFFLLLLALALVPAAAQARPADKGPIDWSPSGDDLVSDIFTAIEAAVISDYYGTKLDDDYYDRKGKGKPKGKKHGKGNGRGKGLPPGLARRDSLPPGLAKQLEERGALPPGLQSRALPRDLLDRLPHRKGTKRVIVDNDIVLIEEGTKIVLDVLTDVIRNAN